MLSRRVATDSAKQADRSAQPDHRRSTNMKMDPPPFRSADNATADVFVEAFLNWCPEHGRMDWPHLFNLSCECAEFCGEHPITGMALAKALRRRGIGSKLRYLQPGEYGYETARRKGTRRPRTKWIDLPRRKISSERELAA